MGETLTQYRWRCAIALRTEGRHREAMTRRVVSAAGESRRIPTTAREVYDVVGAGDPVTAYLAVMLAVKATAYEAAVVANYAAGVEVGTLGAATVSPEEILTAFDARSESA